MYKLASRGIVVAALLAVACNSGGEAASQADTAGEGSGAAQGPGSGADADPGAEAATPAGAVAGEAGGQEKIDEAVADASADADAEPAPPPIVEKEVAPPPAASPDVEEEDTSKYPLHYIAYPDAAVQAEARAVSWTKVADVEGPLTFQPVASGVLAQSGAKTYVLGDDGKLLEKTVEVPTFETVIGHYPNDAWYVFIVPEDRSQESYQLRRWRGNGRWVAQEIAGERARDGVSGDRLAKGWRAGFLVGTQDGGEISFMRAAPAGVADPDPQPILQEAWATDFFETRSGRIYLFINYGQGDEQRSLVQRSCEEEGCHRENARAFPSPEGQHSEWSFARLIPRQRHSMSGLATEYRTSLGAPSGTKPETHHWLVHYEVGGWKLERLPGERKATMIWPVEDGGLWARVEGGEQGQALWHRDPEGKWSYAVLPAGLDTSAPLQVAMATPERLWLAGKVGEQWSVWETPGPAQNPPVAEDAAPADGAPAGDTKTG